jgi:hypothetical protein
MERMITMVDEIYDRAYQSARADLSEGVKLLFNGIGRAVGDSLKVLHRIEWSAPWEAPNPPSRRA